MVYLRTASMAKNGQGALVIKICFSVDDLEVLYKVKTIPGRQYYSDLRCWSAPLYEDNINLLRKWGFSIASNLDKFIEKRKERTSLSKNNIPGLKGVLYPFQDRGVSFIEAHNGRALIADEMGLGKTVQALAWLQLHPEKRPVIVITPASLKLNWERESKSWMGNPRIEILSGTTTWKTKGDLLIINYDILPDWVDELKRRHPQVLITDECHYYKSNSAKRTKAVKRLAKNIPHILALSGTPIVNRPIEIYNAVKIISPDLFPDYWEFIHYYCNAKRTNFGLDISGASHTKELNERLTSSIMIRRLKQDVLPDLPAKVRSFVPIQLHNIKEYRAAEGDFITFIKEQKGAEAAIRASKAKAFAEIEGLKQLSVKGKLEEAIDWIDNFLTVDGKLVVFAVHKFVIDAIMDRFKDIAVKIDGSVSNVARQKAVDSFQNDKNIRLFVGNIQAAGVGITLTASTNVAFLELPWTPGQVSQAEDRCHRIGQKDAVNIYYLLAKGTIEERIARLLDRKREVLDAVLDGIDSDEDSLLISIMNEYL